MSKTPTTLSYYTWKQWVDGRYLTPMSDPYLYEYAFDYFFDSPEDAQMALTDFNVEHEVDETWVLVKVTYTPCEAPPCETKEDEDE